MESAKTKQNELRKRQSGTELWNILCSLRHILMLGNTVRRAVICSVFCTATFVVTQQKRLVSKWIRTKRVTSQDFAKRLLVMRGADRNAPVEVAGSEVLQKGISTIQLFVFQFYMVSIEEPIFKCWEIFLCFRRCMIIIAGGCVLCLP